MLIAYVLITFIILSIIISMAIADGLRDIWRYSDIAERLLLLSTFGLWFMGGYNLLNLFCKIQITIG